MQIIQPKGFITNTTPIFEWEAVQDVTEYNFKLSNNVTSQVIVNEVTTNTTFEPKTALAYGTYAIEVKAEDKDIAIDVIVITPQLAQYEIVGRDGDITYTAYKRYQSAVRQNVKQLGNAAIAVLQANQNLLESIQGDTALQQFHAATIAQTPGLGDDLTLVQMLSNEILQTVQRIAKRDPGF